MFNNKIIQIATVVALAFIFFYTFSNKEKNDAPPSLDYVSRLANERLVKDKFMKESAQSPFKNKAQFVKLNYFNIDNKFKITARLELLKSKQLFVLQTTGNEKDSLQVYGKIYFEINNTSQSALLFRSVVNKLLFFPFRDATSGKETYGGGRYLDIPISNVLGNKVQIDFNQAYQPYCAYNHEYVCPVPPKENTISVAITAGEKL
jgi:uncharacterized protein